MASTIYAVEIGADVTTAHTYREAVATVTKAHPTASVVVDSADGTAKAWAGDVLVATIRADLASRDVRRFLDDAGAAGDESAVEICKAALAGDRRAEWKVADMIDDARGRACERGHDWDVDAYGSAVCTRCGAVACDHKDCKAVATVDTRNGERGHARCAKHAAAEYAPRRVVDYRTGETLRGPASEALVRASAATPAGAVDAYRDELGEWQHVAEQDADHYRRNLHVDVRTVYVEAD